MNSKNPLAKYLVGGAAVGAMAISPFLAPSMAQAQEMTTTTTTTTTVAADPTMVTGTVDNYWLDRSGYVGAMSVKTATGTEIIRFSPSQARRLYTTYPTGSTINVWVTPSMDGRKYWNARGLGDTRPSVWYPVNMTSGYDWLAATPYTTADAQELTLSGKLKGVIIDDRGDVLALAIKNDDGGQTLVRVPAELRHVARGHIGGPRVAPLFQGADVEVKGVREAPRWGVLTPFSGRVAASTIAINGKHAGSIGIQTLPLEQRNALLGWNIGGDATDSMIDMQARELGYGIYRPEGEPMGENMASVSTRPASMTTTTTTTTTTERATGRVMIVTADGQLLPVVRQNNRIWVTGTDGRNVELVKVNGKYAVPASMTGARMQMVMSDGRRMEMDTVDGQLMVILADGSTAPVTLHTP